MDNSLQTSLIDIDIVYEKIVRFIYYMARRYCSDDMMGYDDIVGDLLEEFVKGYRYYEGKIDNIGAFTAVIRQMMAFRIAELRHKQFGTHRIRARMNISIELELVGDEGDTDLTETIPDIDCGQPEELCESMELVEEVKRRISPIAQQVMDMVCSGDKRLTALIFVATMRACGSKPNSHSKIKPWMLAEILSVSEPEVRKAFSEIRNALQEIDNG